MLEVVLRDGRTLSVLLEWYPRLAHGSPQERQRWRLIGDGIGIHLAGSRRGHQYVGTARRPTVRREFEIIEAVVSVATPTA